MKSCLYLLLAGLSVLTAGEWHVDREGENRIVFYSTTPVLDFQGETEAVDGYVYVDGDSLTAGNPEVYFEVRPALFNTGNGKRDRDMREDVLHTERYPLSRFKGRLRLTAREGDVWQALASGVFTLHGVSCPVEITGTVSRHGKGLRIRSRFSLLLGDYNIRAPELLAFVKVAEKIDIEVTLTLKRVK